jgi:GNAT superfamily N-acetyltransferase
VSAAPAIAAVTEADLPDLLPLMRAYCDFYAVAPSDEALLAMSRALVADPEREGVQFVARADSGAAVGFATVFWTWSTTRGARIGVMNDLFVAAEARGAGGGRIGEALIAACAERCRDHGAVSLTWQTALDNARAQALYDRIGAQRSQWLDYDLAVA